MSQQLVQTSKIFCYWRTACHSQGMLGNPFQTVVCLSYTRSQTSIRYSLAGMLRMV